MLLTNAPTTTTGAQPTAATSSCRQLPVTSKAADPSVKQRRGDTNEMSSFGEQTTPGRVIKEALEKRASLWIVNEQSSTAGGYQPTPPGSPGGKKTKREFSKTLKDGKDLCLKGLHDRGS